MSRIKTTVKYPAGHSYSFQYILADCYCPECGSGNDAVWVEDDMGDYYQGPTFVCVDCSSSFTMPYCGDATEMDLQVIDQIKKKM